MKFVKLKTVRFSLFLAILIETYAFFHVQNVCIQNPNWLGNFYMHFWIMYLVAHLEGHVKKYEDVG